MLSLSPKASTVCNSLKPETFRCTVETAKEQTSAPGCFPAPNGWWSWQTPSKRQDVSSYGSRRTLWFQGLAFTTLDPYPTPKPWTVKLEGLGLKFTDLSLGAQLWRRSRRPAPTAAGPWTAAWIRTREFCMFIYICISVYIVVYLSIYPPNYLTIYLSIYPLI